MSTDTFQVTLSGFKTKKQAKEFLNWYQSMGSQNFDDHLDIVESLNKKGISIENGCYIDSSKELPNGYYAEVK